MSSPLVYCKNCKEQTEDTTRGAREYTDRRHRVYMNSICNVCKHWKKEFIGWMSDLFHCERCNRHIKDIITRKIEDVIYSDRLIAESKCAICGKDRKLIIINKNGTIELRDPKSYSHVDNPSKSNKGGK